MSHENNLFTRRTLLAQVFGGAVATKLHAAVRMPQTSSRPSAEGQPFCIRSLDRKYDLHREKGCTVLAIEVTDWPGNEFGLWLPETVYLSGEVVWGNWWEHAHQDFEEDSRGVWTTERAFGQFTVTSTLTPDPTRSCLWYRHTFRNTSNQTLRELNSQTCFHLVNAPQFISLRGSRIWAKLDGQWTTTDKVERDQSPDPRRVAFFRRGLRAERNVVPWKGFAGATMPEVADHPLFIAENFEGNASVGIAARNFEKLFNNNDPILRCLHSESMPVRQLGPGQSAHQDSVIIFLNGDHRAILEHYTNHIEPNWPTS